MYSAAGCPSLDFVAKVSFVRVGKYSLPTPCCALFELIQDSIAMFLRGLALLGLASLAVTAPSASTVNKRYVEERNGVTYSVFKRAGEASSLSYVKNSGICETTP